MNRFLHAHATHPDWRLAPALAAAQIEAQRQAQADARVGAPGRKQPNAQIDGAGHPQPEGQPPRTTNSKLGWVYFTGHYAAEADALLADLRQRWPGVAWVGASGVGIAASGVEYFDEPALSMMLAELPREQFRVFSGAKPLGDFSAHSAQVHADPDTADLAELLIEMSGRTESGYLFGGLASSRGRTVHLAEGVLQGGLSGVAFGADVALVSRVTQGCQPIGPVRTITEAERNVITQLDGEPALDVLMRDLNLVGIEPRDALPKIRQTLVGLNDAPGDQLDADAFRTPARRGSFGSDTRVRHLIGLDPGRRGIAISDHAETGMQLAFCTRNTEAARRDLMRICAEIREEVEPDTLTLDAAMALKDADGSGAGSPANAMTNGIAGAIYVSCAGRGGPHFGAPSAELALVKHALGDVPLVGFFASGEIARQHLYGYTGVLTVFRA
ncbi:FIST C-terminal domain-containing protein [soil metagenome]